MRYLFIQSNQNARECPYCHLYQNGNPHKPIAKCLSCGNTFCFFHSNAHPADQTCQEYEHKLEEIGQGHVPTNINENDACKRCPNCHILTSKISGCNHITCSYCHISWCWICGRKIIDSELSVHYRWWNFLGCPNRMMDNDTNPFRGCHQIWYRILYFLVFAICGLPIVILFFVFSLLCLPFIFCCSPLFLYILKGVFYTF